MKINTVIWISIIAAILLAAPLSVAIGETSLDKGAWEIRAASRQTESSPVTEALAEAESGALPVSEQSSESKKDVLDSDKELSAVPRERSQLTSANDQVAKLSKKADSSEPAQESQPESSDQVEASDSPKTSSQMERELPAVPESGEVENSTVEAVAAEKRETRRLSNDLEQQFKVLRRSLETEDAFSLQLAENYYGYGKLLRESGELEGASDAYINALHIQKINHGLYAPEQRPLLKELFETHYALGNVEEYENYIERILWVEAKNPDLKDDFSFQMLLNLGNRYLDEYLDNPIATTRKVETLLQAKGYLRAVVRRHENKPLSVTFLPYGELALIGYLESLIFSDVDQTSSIADSKIRRFDNVQRRDVALSSYLINSFPSGKAILARYLKKATEEENLDHVVGALISLGDFHQLFGRNKGAIRFYKLAWKAAQELPSDSLRLQQFSTPTALPSFEYAKKRVPIIPDRPSVLVPVKITIQGDGKVTEVDKFSEDSEYIKLAPRARRAAKKLIFRPRFIDGELAEEQKIDYQLRIYIRKKVGAPDA